MELVLHDHHRAVAGTRLRVGLALKGLSAHREALDLMHGDQRRKDFLALNPQGLVPVLETPDGTLTQSLAILEWLDETYPEPPLLPRAPGDRARVRAIAQALASDVQPLSTPRVLRSLEVAFGADRELREAWSAHWMTLGFDAVERLLDDPRTGAFCHGDAPGLADCCLFAQAEEARLHGLDLERWPRLCLIHAQLTLRTEIADAAPAAQSDAPLFSENGENAAA